MATATYIGKDQNRQDETTIYWFDIEGHDNGTGVDFDNSTFGIAERGSESFVIDDDGDPMVEDGFWSFWATAVRNTAEVTDEMRSE